VVLEVPQRSRLQVQVSEPVRGEGGSLVGEPCVTVVRVFDEALIPFL